MTTAATEFNRMPPHNIDAEVCLLGSMLLDADARVEQVAAMTPADFFGADNAVLFRVLAEMTHQRRAVDGVLLVEELGRRSLLAEVGGAAYVGQVLNTVPTAAHAAHYARVLREKSKLRAAITLAHDAIRQAYAPAGEDRADDILRGMARGADGVVASGTADTIVRLDRAVADVLASKAAGTRNRRLTGLADFDAMTGGLPIGGLTYVAAPAGMGKSQFCKQVVHNVGRGVGHPENAVPCGIVAAEESVEKIVTNYLAGASGVRNSRVVYNTDLTADDWSRLYAAGGNLSALPIVIDDAQRQLSRVEASIRRMVRTHGCKVVVVDHLHLLDGEMRGENRTAEVTKLSRTLKGLFKELGVCGVVAAQVNRTGDPLEPPELRHLRDSGSLEADGDLIVQFRRRDYVAWKQDPANFRPDHRLEAFINKNKDGAMGAVDLYFDGDAQTITDWNDGRGPHGTYVPDFG